MRFAGCGALSRRWRKRSSTTWETVEKEREKSWRGLTLDFREGRKRGWETARDGGDDAQHRTRVYVPPIPENYFNANEKFFSSLSTINNQDKGFMVARETAAIKVSGCFQSVNSVPRSRSETEKAPLTPRPPFFPSVYTDRSLAYRRRYRRRWSVFAYTRMLHLPRAVSPAITVLDVPCSSGTRCCSVRKNVTPRVVVQRSHVQVDRSCSIFAILHVN